MAVGILTLTAKAVEIERATDGGYQFEATTSNQDVNPAERCGVTITGRFGTGDARRITDFLDRTTKYAGRALGLRHIVCLDSTGGSFAEAMKVARFFKENLVGTKIEAEASCLSACALVFMAGSFLPLESDQKFAWRVLHPRGKLGFHRPSLEVSRGNYNEAAVGKAYGIALETISNLVEEIVFGQDARAAGMRISLLSTMLNTRAEDMLFVDTVDKAGRWDILVWPIIGFQKTNRTLEIACAKYAAWRIDEFAVGNRWIKDFSTRIERKASDNGVQYIELQRDDWDGCYFHSGTFINDMNDQLFGATMTRRQDNLFFYAPSTLLTNLAIP